MAQKLNSKIRNSPLISNEVCVFILCQNITHNEIFRDHYFFSFLFLFVTLLFFSVLFNLGVAAAAQKDSLHNQPQSRRRTAANGCSW